MTTEKQAFIRDNYLKLPSRKIATLIGINKTTVLRFLKFNNLVVPSDLIYRWKYETNKKPYTAKENEYIITHIATKTIKAIAADLKRSSTTLQKQVHILGLTNIIEDKIKKSRLQKGHVPPNVGKKLHEFMSPQTLAKFKANWFAKGQLPYNTLADGSEVFRKDKAGRSYTLIKIPGERKLIFKHRYVWEQHYKKEIPKDYAIVFIDSDTQNCDINNLECISRGELMNRNMIHNYPQDLQDLLRIKGQITRQINKHHKNDNRTKK